MLILKEEVGGGILAVWKTEESIGELTSSLGQKDWLNHLLQQYKTDKRRLEVLAVRMLLENVCGINGGDLAYSETGKPYLKSGNFNISISHTNGYVSLLLHPTCEVGVDIECRSERVRNVKDRFLSCEELSVSDSTEYLLLCWCTKEALFKMMSCNNVDFSAHLHIEPFVCQEKGEIRASETRTMSLKKYKLNYILNDSFSLVWSVDTL